MLDINSEKSVYTDFSEFIPSIGINSEKSVYTDFSEFIPSISSFSSKHKTDFVRKIFFRDFFLQNFYLRSALSTSNMKHTHVHTKPLP
jgi:hypothetical protein